MKMAKFKITWENGEEETVDQTDCTNVEQYINCRFGAGVNPVAKVSIEDVPVSNAKKTAKKAASE